MAAPFAAELFSINSKTGFPNCADKNNKTSVGISNAVLQELGVSTTALHSGQSAGANLEWRVAAYLDLTIPQLAPNRDWVVFGKELPSDGSGKKRKTDKKAISFFRQYEHLKRLEEVMTADETGLLRVEIGADYLIEPDVTVGLMVGEGSPYLHAAVSCKWTIRSDRVQNIRHEGTILTRHRRGRQPHIVAVTAEPVPSRIAAIARGTGEVDAVYHIALPELEKVVATYGNQDQYEYLGELLDQGRLRDFNDLPHTLVSH